MVNESTGIYSVAEAARLSNASAREIRRWLYGYSFPSKKLASTTKVLASPLWTTQIGEASAIGFRDLMELRFVKHFVSQGVSLQLVRSALQSARSMFQHDYPFTARKFLTDGKRIFHDAIDETEKALTDVASKQVVIDPVIRPSLYAGIEYAKSGLATKWYPVPKSKIIVLDPQRSFGAPVIEDYGVPTFTLAAAYKVEKSASSVALQYKVPRAAVIAASKFEDKLPA